MPMLDQPKQGRQEMPPIGLSVNDTDITVPCDEIVKELRQLSNEWNVKADKNKLMFYAGTENPDLDCDKIVFNRIRPDIKTAVNQQTKDPAQIKLMPVETNDPGDFYSFDPALTTEAIDPMMAQELMAPKPVVDEMSGEPMVDEQTGQPAMQPGLQLFKMDDKAQADFWQRQFDVHFKRGGMWSGYRRTALNAAIYGFYFPTLEYNIGKKKWSLRTSDSVWDIHVDAIGCDDFAESQVFGKDYLLTLWQARQMYPEHAEIINEYAKSGNMKSASDVELGGGRSHNYNRNMILMRHLWFRNHPILMTKKEIIAGRRLPTVMVDTGTVDQQMMPVMQEDLAADPVTGEQPNPFIVGDDGEMTVNPDWPLRFTTRHVIYLPDLKVLVEDEECQYSDIPAGWMPGDPIPGQLFGTGYPESFRASAQAKNRIINAAVEYVETFPVPGATLPEDLADCIAKSLPNHMLKPGDMLKIPGHYVEKYGGADKCIGWNTPAPLPPSVAEILQIITAETRDTAFATEASQGKQPGKIEGWQSIQMLQQAAANQFDFPMQWFTDMIVYLSNIMLNGIIRWSSTEDLMAVCSEYPPHIVEAFRQKGLAAEWNIDVTLAQVVGIQKARERVEAIEDRQILDPITGRPALSGRSYAEKTNIDYDEEQRRMDEEQASPAAMQKQAIEQEERDKKSQPPGKEKSGSGSSNGNGNGRF